MREADLAEAVRPLLGELTRFARWLAVEPADADEIVQETLTRALRAAGQIRDRVALRAWLFTIARRAHADLRRSRASHDRFVVLEGGLDDLADVALEAQTPPRPIERRDLERALARLPEGARVALLLTDLWEFDHDEVARILDIPVNTVKSRVTRARARVASWLSEGDDTERRQA